MFCDIAGGHAPAVILRSWNDAIAIRPLNPVARDHFLVLPRRHVADASTDPDVTAATMRRAAELLTTGSHIGANVGAEAGQTVFHLHIHIWGCRAPRTCMPWEHNDHPV
ncbi:HIT family protein [Nocardiopsis protaetiae]|uniref:HIT family protein n=1 Tax=Nocardiopsis protaetiae TaxID=3382270 RepID=UPI00387A861B